ncbi:MAG: dipeptide ABC transporter ATP-binding protein [Thermogutta sp.]
MSDDVLLRVRRLRKYFPGPRSLFSGERKVARAVDGVSFDVRKGEVLGLVGESGCGKTTVGRTLLRLIEPTSGTIEFMGRDITHLQGKALRDLRREMQIVFQDPFSSLNPRMTVGAAVEEGLLIHAALKKQADRQHDAEPGSRDEAPEDWTDPETRRRIVTDLFARMRLPPNISDRYPHQFSGGQRQRICVARAVALRPKFLVLDEPLSALDVSLQAEIINLLMKLKTDFDLTYLFISHDLSVVEYLSDRVAVMYLGQIVETADSRRLYAEPLHPYTQALLSAVPQMDPTAKRRRIVLEGDVPSPDNPPTGCRFHPRCPLAQDICKREAPRTLDLDGHIVKCHVVEMERGKEGRILSEDESSDLAAGAAAQ